MLLKISRGSTTNLAVRLASINPVSVPAVDPARHLVSNLLYFRVPI